MEQEVTRRCLLNSATGVLLASRITRAAEPAPPGVKPSAVGLIQGEDRRKNITEALKQIDDQIAPLLKRRKTVVIKPNLVSTNRQLAATHVDALRGILDYLETRWKGPVVIAESSAGDTLAGYENFKYNDLRKEKRRFSVDLVDLNEEGLYEVQQILNADLHPQPVRLAKRLLDPDAFVISAGVLKTHNVVIASLNIKNMTLGAPLHSKKGETKRWNDKRVYHGGVRQTHYGIMLTAQRMAPSFGIGVIDGFEGMEGNGPASGTPVASRIAIASTDMVAADRIGVETMGIDTQWMGYLSWCSKYGVGQFERDRIQVRGDAVEKVAKKYRMHADIERELQWMGKLEELPPKLG
jgi:uncharacterized protein (DUF362 family)